MDRKWIGVLISLVLAAVGTWVLVQYVNGADDRAREGANTVDVLVVSDSIPEGTSVSDLRSRVETQRVPAESRADGSVTSLTSLEGTVTAVDLVPGEQVLASRFVTPQQLAETREFTVPDDLLGVTVSLSPDRAVGGELAPGDLVAVIASFEPFDINGVVPSDDGSEVEPTVLEGADLKTPNSSGIIVHKAIVTNVQVEALPAADNTESAEEQGVELAPTGNLLVTIATEAPYVEKIVFAAEWGFVWLALEGELAAEEFDQVQTRNLVYRDILTVDDLVAQ